jgi:deoxyribodipyrimidine photo-lyase
LSKAATPSLVWFRQDLRIADQAALAAAAEAGPIVPVYVLDDESPGDWAIGGAQRWWLHHSLANLSESLKSLGSPLILRRGRAAIEIAKLAKEVGATRLHLTTHYEPWWQAAEDKLGETLELCRHPGSYLADPRGVRTGSDGRYRIFTPFWRALSQQMPPPAPIATPRKLEAPSGRIASDRLTDWNLLPTKPDWSKGFDVWKPGEAAAHAQLDAFADRVGPYDHARNLPSIDGSSRLSPHLHFGELSAAAVWHRLHRHSHAQVYLREIGWRDFGANLIDQFADYGAANGRPAMDRLPWRSGKAADADFDAWTKGRTGYPIVDAGMRQLWAMGWMHNRVRMIAASFLIKHLLIDWRRGERWFWETLVDADYGNNSMNWQWVSGTGVDSSPFGRIMAPLTQSPKFEAEAYIRQWVPELAELSDEAIHDPHGVGAKVDYPAPLIGHREGRERALEALATVRG